MTNLDIITRALRLIGVLAEGSTPKAEQSRDALAALDGLLAAWEREGVTPTPRPLTLVQTPALADAYLDAMVYGLAVRIAPEYGMEPTATVARVAHEREARLLAGGRVAVDASGVPVTIITRAMRLIGVLRDGDLPRLTQVQNGLATLDGILSEWEGFGFPISPHPVTATTLLAIPPQHMDALIYTLAVQMAPEFGVQPAPTVLDRADRRQRQVMAAYVPRPAAKLDDIYIQPRGWGGIRAEGLRQIGVPVPVPVPVEPDLVLDPVDLVEQQAHRFFASMTPQNTLVGAENALLMGYTRHEFDMQVTADKVPVLFHDNSVDSLTDGTGELIYMTLAQVKALDAGVKFKGGRFTGTRIPTLQEYLAFVRGRVTRMYAELKRYAVVDDIRLMVQPFVDQGLEDITDIASSRMSDLEYVRRVMGNRRIGIELAKDDITVDELAFLKALGGRVNVALSYEWVLSNPAMVPVIRSYGIGLCVYTVPGGDEYAKLAAIGVTRIISDRPILPPETPDA